MARSLNSGEFDVDGSTIVGISGSGAEIDNITAREAASRLGSNDIQFSSTPPFLDANGVTFDTSNSGGLDLYFFVGERLFDL
jgi:hypothetical protein